MSPVQKPDANELHHPHEQHSKVRALPEIQRHPDIVVEFSVVEVVCFVPSISGPLRPASMSPKSKYETTEYDST